MAPPKGHLRYGGRTKGTPNKSAEQRAAERKARFLAMSAVDREAQEMRRVAALEHARQEAARLREEVGLTTELPHIPIEDMDPLSVVHAIMLLRWYAGDLAGALAAAVQLAPYTNSGCRVAKCV